jgi:DNA-nicking Smr family endonuclease
VSSALPLLDLHGADRQDAVQRLDRWLQCAFMAGAVHGTVVCGRGRGILLQVIASELEAHPLVRGYRREGPRYLVQIAGRHSWNDID